MHKRGVALVIGLMVILVLSILGSVIISRSISEARAARRYVESTQAFWLAEAGLNQALKNLRDGSSASIYPTRLPAGADRGYSATISGASSPWTVTAYG
ncbi:MAG: PilX N-terminal domain-containing pilus assembly protein, partial [Deltaproteobacteria bacterium]